MTKFEGGLEIKKLDSVESIEAEIKMLQSKLEFYKELEKTKTPVEQAYKKWWGEYPGNEIWPNFDDTRWGGFQAGYAAAQKDYKVGEYQPNPQTPEQVADGLKEAFREAVKQGVVSSIDKPKDKEDENFKNTLDLIKKWGEDNKPLTLKELLWEWWENIFTVNSDLDADASIDYLVDIIDKKFIPPSSEKNTYNWERCLKSMREKLR